VAGVHRVPARDVQAQIAAVFDDFAVGAVKTGMLASAAIVHAVADALAARRRVPLVLDPVLIASSGARLLDERARGALCRRLLPLARVVTPNLPEAEWLTGIAIRTDADAEAATARLRAMGARAVLLKGGHARGREVVDRLDDDGRRATFRHRRLPLEAHGTGCTLAAAIAAGLANRLPLEQAVDAAVDYVHGALQRAYRPGRGSLAVLEHRWRDMS
jgi:hydroxymethylpyrimidine/phosphomethylpyrimidine kinase